MIIERKEKSLRLKLSYGPFACYTNLSFYRRKNYADYNSHRTTSHHRYRTSRISGIDSLVRRGTKRKTSMVFHHSSYKQAHSPSCLGQSKDFLLINSLWNRFQPRRIWKLSQRPISGKFLERRSNWMKCEILRSSARHTDSNHSNTLLNRR